MNVLKRFTLAIVLTLGIGIVASQEVKAEITNYPNGVSSWGFPVLPGIGSELFADVNVFWVDSRDPNAANGAGGGTVSEPFRALDFAIGQCVANQGDVILVKPESIATVTGAGGLDLDVAGITIIGIGQGTHTPTIRFTTASTADMDVDAPAITMRNFHFEARTALLAAPIDVNAPDFRLINCKTRDIIGAGSATTWILTDANADRMLIDGYRHIGTLTGTVLGVDFAPVAAITITGGDDIIIRDFNIYGDFNHAGILGTVTAATRINIYGANGRLSNIWTEHATDGAIAMNTATTGWIGPNIAAMLQENAANLTAGFSGSNCQFVSPLPICNLAGEQTATTAPITMSTN